MSKEKYYKTLLSPHVTEKASMSLGENAQTVFKVAMTQRKSI
jgi:ribosomal protein L23